MGKSRGPKDRENKLLAIRMMLGDPSAATKLLSRAAFHKVDPEGESSLVKSLEKVGDVIGTATSIATNFKKD